MAIIKPSAIVDAISGNLGGVNFAQGKGSPYARQRIRRVKPTSAKYAQVGSRMQFLRHKWQQLTENQRTAWRRAAVIKPRHNRFGLRKSLSGAQLFISHNMHGWYDEGMFATSFDENPPKLPPPPPIQIDSITMVSGGTKEFIFLDPGPPEPFIIVIYGARTFSTSPRLTWHNFKFIARDLLLAKPPRLALGVTQAWDLRIGDPVTGEQCWIAWFIAGPNSWPTPTFIASTFAT